MSRPEATPRDTTGLVLGAFLVLASALIVEVAGGYAFHTNPAMRTLTQVLVGALLVLWAGAAVVRPALRPRTVLAGPVAIAMVAFGASVFASERPRLSLEPALIGVASALTLLMLTALLRVPVIRRLVATTVLFLAAGIAVGYLIQVGIEWNRWWGLVGHFTAPPLRPSFVALSFGSPNLIATFLLLLAPLGAVIATQRFGRWAGAGLVVLAVIAIVITGSRGGYLGLAAATGVAFAVSLPWLWSRLASVRERLGSTRLVGLAVGGAAAVAIAAVVLAPSVLGRLTLSGAELRGWYWRSATELFERSPLTGTGPGTWAQLKLAEALPGEANYSVPHAHSLYFQTISEVGILGAGALLLLVAVFLWRSVQVYRRGDVWTRMQVVAVLVGLAGLVAQQIPDYLMNLPGVTLVAGLLIAWVDGADAGIPDERSLMRASVSRRLATPVAIALGAVLLISAPTTLTINRAMWIAQEANVKAAAGDWADALASYDEAIAADPDFTLYRLERANALAHLGRLEEARQEYRPMVEVDLLPENLLGLAAIELALGNPGRAAELARIGIRHGWRNATVELNVGRILEATGDRAGALEAYGAALYTNPALARSSYWELADRTVTRDAVVSSARGAMHAASDHGSAAIVAAYAGHIDMARTDAAAIQDDASRRLTQAVIEGIGGDRRVGMEELRAIVDSSPGEFTATIWLARFLNDVGHPEAEEFTQRAIVMRADEGPSLVVEYSVVPSIEEERFLGAWTSYPFAVYSRQGPPDLWPPQLLVIGVTEPP